MAKKGTRLTRAVPKSAREGALQVLYAVEVEGAYANLVLDQLLREASFSKLDRAFITEMVYGTLRWQKTVDWVLGQVLHTGIAGLTPWIRNILRLGTYQLLFMDRIPVSAVCNEGTNLAKRYGHQGVARLVNGVLRNVARHDTDWPYPDPREMPVEYLAIRYSHPEWMVKRWLGRYGYADTLALLKTNNRAAPNSIRTNTLRITPAKLADLLAQEGAPAEKSALVPEGLILKQVSAYGDLKAMRQGLFQVQDESSMLAGYGLKPSPGTRVIDVCAGPGGKTTHLAQFMEKEGEIVALDLHEHKVGLIGENCRRLGINIVQTIQRDARDLPGPWEGWADFALVDAPCSGLGVLRRRPDARWQKSAKQIQELAGLQQEILQAASRCVKPGGVLLYSTCTLEPEENEDQINRFLGGNRNQAEFKLEDLSECLPFVPQRAEEQQQIKQGRLTLLPYVYGTDGFFLARMRRVGSN